MTFEQIIKNISKTISGVAVFAMTVYVYLQAKGFSFDENGNFVLGAANAAELPTVKEVPADFAFPQDHVLGQADAPVTLYEYSSFGCSHCADFHLEILPQLIEKYVDNGLLKVVFVPLPLDKNSMDGALLGECMADDKYFDFVTVLFKRQNDWGLALNPQKVLLQYAALSGLGAEKAAACLKNDKNAAKILSERQRGLADLGIEGTPTFVLSSDSGNELISGLQPSAGFEAVIEARLPKADNVAAEN